MSLCTVDFTRFPLRAGDRVLDLGCGEGRHIITACTLADISAVGVDLSTGDIDVARQRFRELDTAGNPRRQPWFAAVDARRLPFADASFDRIICSEVLEHIVDYEQVLDEIRRILRPGGLLAVSVPRFFPEWVCWQLSTAYHETVGGHVRIFREAALRRDIEMRDFILYARHFAHALHVPYWWLRCWYWDRVEAAAANRKAGMSAEDPWPVAAWHRMLVRDLMQQPFATRLAESLLNPLLGKSVVLYFVRQAHAGPTT